MEYPSINDLKSADKPHLYNTIKYFKINSMT